jgi:UDP-MurNAc hydroxylase
MNPDTPPGIRIRYVYSACVVLSTPDVRVLADPWFTDGAYDGSWFAFPQVADPMETIGDVDLIYVSHLHPDHYDPAFLKRYFARYGAKEVVIAAHAPNHLANKMRVDGIRATVLEAPRRVGDTEIEIWPHRTGSASDIDSAILVRYRDPAGRRHSVVNANDIIFDPASAAALKSAAGEVDVLLCGYTGAGPYPQTYFDFDDPRLPAEADKKKQAFFERYKRLVQAMDARLHIPFAGQYLLGGRLARLNPVRGVADAVEVLAFDERAVVLGDDGGEISTADLRRPTRIRTEPYDPAALRARERQIAQEPMDYERLIDAREVGQLPLKRLLAAAARKAIERSECDEDYFFAVHLPADEVALINARPGAERPIAFQPAGAPLPEPRSELFVDPRYLFGLLTYVYHWNNAEVGSQYDTRRVPNALNRKAQAFLNFLAL